MGNITSGILNYLGWKDAESLEQVVGATSNIHSEALNDNVNTLINDADTDGDNFVTKAELEHYFDRLSNKIDSNSDGVVSKDELEKYVRLQLDLSNRELSRWKESYEVLYEEYEELKESLLKEETRVLEISNISNRVLKDYIEKEIIHTNSNIKMLPDIIERRAYLKLYKTLLKSIEKLSNKTALELLGHKISFAIQPIVKEDK